MAPVDEGRHTELRHAQGSSHRRQNGTAHIKNVLEDKHSTRNADRLRKANTIKISRDKIVI